MKIVAVGFGAPDKLAAWADKEKYAYELWSDADHVLAKAYGADGTMSPRRVTRVLDAEGRTVLTYDSVDVSTHPEDVLADCKRLFGPK